MSYLGLVTEVLSYYRTLGFWRSYIPNKSIVLHVIVFD